MQILVDTNVFLDYFFDRDKNEAALFFNNCFTRSNKIFVTTMTLRDAEYISHRILHDKKKSKDVQMAIYKISQKVIGISSDATIESLYSEVDDYEDALQAEAAKEALLDAIVTNNKRDFAKSGIPVFTPKELNEIWNK